MTREVLACQLCGQSHLPTILDVTHDNWTTAPWVCRDALGCQHRRLDQIEIERLARRARWVRQSAGRFA